MDYSRKSSVEDIRKNFDGQVERFSNLETGQSSTMDAPLVMELICEAALAVKPDTLNLLDIGCGAGNNTLKLLGYKPDINCDLLDLSGKMLERALQRVSAAARGGKVRAIQGDFRTAELPRNHYDAVFAAAVLHHLRDDRDWEDTFAKIYDVVAPGGSVWISDIVVHSVGSIEKLMFEKRFGDHLIEVGGEQLKEYIFSKIESEDSPRTLLYQLELLKKSGFEQVEILHKNAIGAAFGAVKRK